LGVKRAIGIFFGVLGVFLITTNLSFQTLGQSTVFGGLAVLLSGIIWAFFTVYNKKLVSNTKDIIQPITWVLFITLLPLIPFLAFSTSTPFRLPIQGWLAIAYTAVFCWVIPYYLWSEGLKSISPVSSTLILLVEIVVSLVVSSLMLNEMLTLISGVGAIFIIAAIIFAS
jgi:drug/metabolite transporter (DMT)-like permease